VFPVRYELDSYILFRINSVFTWLVNSFIFIFTIIAIQIANFFLHNRTQILKHPVTERPLSCILSRPVASHV
jgi:hypothetical protein